MARTGFVYHPDYLKHDMGAGHPESPDRLRPIVSRLVAIAARYLQRRHGVARVLIVDWDVHHGNGTQHTFDDDPSVLFFSTHQYPHYPGTGGSIERGKGKGEGLTINVPMSAGQGDEDYREVFEQLLVPA